MAGYNTKIEHNMVTYIVQTQDLGSPTHCIESLIYKSGRTLPPSKDILLTSLEQPLSQRRNSPNSRRAAQSRTQNHFRGKVRSRLDSLKTNG